ncbi:MAG TPA: hypothetical protein PKC31_00495 [Candidatus Nanoperiomorbaceae bacterium]|nr:hypothetical protein [Candidatus Nanoperiomorbaceae bacterium]HMQ96508.1 hypothetical protein [Candidatus Nanoperiomorbaceae bacterium]HMR85925.1 hypothetical protein [Candidatus Nanoperiomorbaceae bacterium]HMU11796.1 hypothetical protein [Candidatus Nanoperiomorbaceae bacterium]
MPLRAITTYTQNTSSTVSITVPAASVEGDIAVLIIASSAAITTDLSSSGWNSIGSSPITNSSGRLTVWSKVVTAPDINATINLSTATSSRFALAVMVRYDVAGFDATPVFNATTPLTTTPTAPGITTSTAGAELVNIYGCLSNASGALLTYTIPVSQTKIADITSPSGSNKNAGFAIGEEILIAAGETNVRTAMTTENSDPPLADARTQQGTLTLAFTPTAVPLAELTVKVRQSGSWVSKTLKTRSSGVWI